jgi:NitT/TauT family transport system substrate-binding protein
MSMRIGSGVIAILLVMVGVTGCGRAPTAADGEEQAFSVENPRRIVLQTDWLPQAEHGGFYQALMKGYYAEAGLEVVLLPGGPGMVNIKQLVARGDADFGIHRSDTLILSIAEDSLPFTMVAAVMQHDSQALMVHDASPVRTFADLEGQTLVASPGQAWLAYIERRFGVKFDLVPNRSGIAAFLGDPSLIQQCLLTNEPFTARAAGTAVRTLAIADSGYDSYSVLFGRRDFVRENPRATQAFLEATWRGWLDFLDGDPTPAFDEIRRRNPSATPELMAFARSEMIRNRTVTGYPLRGERIGNLSASRLRAEIATLADLGILRGAIPVGELALPDYLSP